MSKERTSPLSGKTKKIMEKMNRKILAYLQENIGSGKSFVYDKSVPDDERSEVWGFKTIKILTVEKDNLVRYRVTPSK